MTRIFTPQKRLPLIRYLLVLTALAALASSCTINDYQTPATTSTPTALITPETLKSWIDAGKVNGTGYDRVVVLDVNSLTNYSAGHVPLRAANCTMPTVTGIVLPCPSWRYRKACAWRSNRA